ncbi:SSI family serine proteinase inhibitor [Streptomyces sp. NPDC006923]|uniref:SSI family serine proteinase inhibitor n=1 Tax=Streptomyces sp. NPDC006923 TaxID=3155355 RepID=UPI0033EE647F
MPRRPVFTAVTALAACAAALSGIAPAASAAPGPSADSLTGLAALPLPLLENAPDEFTVTVADSGLKNVDGTYKLKCEPAGGTHPQARAACDRLATLAREGRDPFAPVPKDTQCTLQYGGPATARVTGTWQGRSVDAAFSRKDGCEIARWQTLEPVLPSARS